MIVLFLLEWLCPLIKRWINSENSSTICSSFSSWKPSTRTLSPWCTTATISYRLPCQLISFLLSTNRLYSTAESLIVSFFFSDKVCENYRLVEIKNDFSNEFGERTYAFRSDEGRLRRLWFWDGSIQFFTPINDYVQEEMELWLKSLK